MSHYHDVDEEWFYILTGSGTLLCAGEGKDAPVAEGVFLGFSTTKRQPHSFRAGMEYLTGTHRDHW